MTRRLVQYLFLVNRLEEIECSRLEYSGGQLVVQYREQIMPLIDISAALSNGCYQVQTEGQESVHVLVYGREGHAIGLLVHRIADIVHEKLTIRTPPTREGVAFTSVVQGKVTDIIDVCSLVRAIAPQYGDEACFNPTTYS